MSHSRGCPVTFHVFRAFFCYNKYFNTSLVNSVQYIFRFYFTNYRYIFDVIEYYNEEIGVEIKT
jgi:hypothetical protein